MFTLILVVCSASLVFCQTTPPASTQHPTHPSHHTHPPDVKHTFVDTNMTFLKDLAHKIMVLKSDSGCYLTHLHEGQINNIDDLEHLLHLESAIIHQVRHAQSFRMAQNTNQYSSEIQTNCPKLYTHHGH